jgi:ABC transport system ATP-binding/permease protein
VRYLCHNSQGTAQIIAHQEKPGVSTSRQCAFCQAPLSRPDARFCTKCGRQQPPEGQLPVGAVLNPPRKADAPTVIGLPAATPPPATTMLPPAGGTTMGVEALLQINDGTTQNEVKLGPLPMSLGRANDNDIVLASRFVSGHHARLEPEGNAHRIIDVGSTNGLLYEGKRIERRSLVDGDVLRIGDPATGNFVTLTYRNSGASRTPQAGQIARSYRLDPNDTQITIGRAGCDINLENPQVSRFHCQIDRASTGQHVLRDAGSTNGTFVNGQRASQHALASGDVIQLGAFKLVYTGTSLDEYDQRGALRIDARALRRVVGQGKQQRTILHEVSLSIAPREFVAIVGGSGTGKSTLMKALCGYAPANSGTVLINGDDFYVNFNAYRGLLGYVPQDDIIHRGLPVGRALGYAARLRLPADTAPSEIAGRVSRVLDDVEMAPHRQTMVESLSGGQRKRVSIGAELLADPSLFYLDEPTSGLDPGLEKKMMYTLRRLADSGRTVLLVTHATANITQCDHVIFMAGGRAVFFGPPREALSFFNVTSGDFADIYTKLDGPADPQSPLVQRELKAEYDALSKGDAQSTPTLAQGASSRSAPTLAQLWEAKYRNSPYYTRYVTDRLAAVPQGPLGGGTQLPTQAGGRQPRISAASQFLILARRYIDLTLGDRRNLWILFLQAPIIGILLLLVARADALLGAQAAGLLQRGEAKKVLFMLATVSVWFGIINAAREIAKEQPIYRRERLVNLRIAAYLGSKVLVLGALVLLQTIVLLGIVFAGVGFPTDTGVVMLPLLEVFVTLFLTALAGVGMGLAISSFSATPDRAISLVPLALIPQIIFAGLIFKIQGLATPLSWLTISRWSMLMPNPNRLCNLPNTNDSGGLPAGCSPGFLESEAAYTHEPGQLLFRWGILIIYTLVCLLVAGWLLKRRDREV